MPTMDDLLLDRLTKYANSNPKKVAMTFLSSGAVGTGGTIESQLTYGEIATQIDAMAVYFLSKGMKKGDMVILVFLPSLDFTVAFLSCLKIGLVAVPVFPPNPSRKDTLYMFSKIVDSCEAKFVLTNSSYSHMKKLSDLKNSFMKIKRRSQRNDSWPDNLHWIVTNDVATMSKSNIKEYKKYKQMVEESIISSHDLAFLQYTSGSTSDPKGVMIKHENLSDNLKKICNELQTTEDCVAVSWLPQYHDMGLIGSYLSTLYCGASGYFLSPLTFMQRPMIWIEATSRFGGTHLQAPNFAFGIVARKFNPTVYTFNKGDQDGRNTSKSPHTICLESVQHIINGAEPVTEECIDKFMDAFRPFGLRSDVMFPTYGLAEHTVFVCSGGKQKLKISKSKMELDGIIIPLSNDESNDSVKLFGCGFPKRQNVDVKIVATDCNMKALGENMVGEIWVKSKSKAGGYYKDPKLTKSQFCAQIGVDYTESDLMNGDPYIDGEGYYLRTGDLGFMHNDELFICGRIKDLIILGGRNYYPQDIERTAEANSDLVRPGCSAAFTVDPVNGEDEQVALILELRVMPKGKEEENRTISLLNDIRAAVNKEHSLALSHIVFIYPKSVPKTSSGKIARSSCRRAFLQGKLKVICNKSFVPGKSGDESESTAIKPFEIDENANGLSASSNSKKVRSLNKNEILQKLTESINQITSIPTNDIDKHVSLTTMMDSLTISQFKGLLETKYATKLSDEYLFREETTLNKLVEIVKIGYAPDDVKDGDAVTPPVTTHGNQGGLAGALGCPPGVVCCVVM